jgi:predicted nucleotide-binding protein
METETSCFIVHGHDKSILIELKAFLKSQFGFDRIIVLREEPERGQTIIEKFEAEVTRSDIAFILLTPDDFGGRPRQNVVFEAGYFMAKYGRKQGRCVLLKKGDVELPSDLSGMLTIDITSGFEHQRKQIEKEIKDWI